MYTYGRSRVKVKVEPHSTFTFTRAWPFIHYATVDWINPYERYSYARKTTHEQPSCLCFLLSSWTLRAYALKNYATVEIHYKVERCSTFTFTRDLPYTASEGLFTRREGNPCARVTLASGLKLALVYKQISQVGLPYHPGQLYQLCWRPKFEIILKFPIETDVKLTKNREYIIIINRTQLFIFQMFIAQKLDNTGHAWRRKVDRGRRVIPSWAFIRQVG